MGVGERSRFRKVRERGENEGIEKRQRPGEKGEREAMLEKRGREKRWKTEKQRSERKR